MDEKGIRRGRFCPRGFRKDPRSAAPHRAAAPLGGGAGRGRSGSGRGGFSNEAESETPRFRVLCRLAERIRGLKGVDASGVSVVLVPCRDIHTFGMDAPIDVAFVDGAGIVIAVHRGVVPGRRLRQSGARMVVERRARAGRWFERGDCLFGIGLEERGRRGSRGLRGGGGTQEGGNP